MLNLFSKTKECGCVVVSIVCGIKKTEKSDVYLLGAHEHVKMCSNCKLNEENNIDTLYDMWYNDNVTDGVGSGGWIEYKK